MILYLSCGLAPVKGLHQFDFPSVYEWCRYLCVAGVETMEMVFGGDYSAGHFARVAVPCHAVVIIHDRSQRIRYELTELYSACTRKIDGSVPVLFLAKAGVDHSGVAVDTLPGSLTRVAFQTEGDVVEHLLSFCGSIYD